MASFAFSFYLPSSICMNLGEVVNHCGFKGVFLGGSVSV